MEISSASSWGQVEQADLHISQFYHDIIHYTISTWAIATIKKYTWHIWRVEAYLNVHCPGGTTTKHGDHIAQKIPQKQFTHGRASMLARNISKQISGPLHITNSHVGTAAFAWHLRNMKLWSKKVDDYTQAAPHTIFTSTIQQLRKGTLASRTHSPQVLSNTGISVACSFILYCFAAKQ